MSATCARLALAIALLLALPACVLAQDRATLPDIEDEVMCPICGTPLEHSQAPQAERERALIRRLIDKGRSKEEIKNALVAEYGPEVLAVPEDEGIDLAAWLVPGIGLTAAAAGVAILIGRRRRAGPGAAPRPLTDEDAERVDSELERWDG